MSAGRPRTFDLDQALDHALRVFWRKGYEGASLLDLTAAMGINRPSLYAAFGDKEQLFRRTIDRYLEGPARHVREALEKPTARQVVEHLWRGGIELVAGPRNPKGCLIVQSALACGNEADSLRREMSKRRTALVRRLRERFERARREGDLPKRANADDLARYATTVSHGIAVQAASGATREELQRVADIALAAWPK